MNDPLPAWFWPLLPLAAVGFFCLISLILSAVGGWRRLAEAYPDDVPAHGGVTFHWQSAQVGAVNYNRCINVTVDPTRLRLSVMVFFRVGHPPVSIPLTDVSVEVGRAWFGSVGTLRLAREPNIRIRLRRGLVDRIAEASAGQLRIHES